MSNPIARNGVVVAVSATILIIFNVAIVVCIRRRHSREISEVEKKFDEELKKERAQRGKERLGRISVQKKSRERLTQENLKSGYQYRPIGYVQSPFPDRRGCPRQPVLVPAALGKIKFDKSIIQFEHFKEIVQFSHIWVIFVFHDNTNGDTEADNIPARIKPPRLGGAKVGCLTTRSPHRPNAIGLSVCEIIDVGPDYISVCGIDMVDGTPVLDIKPYIPYDSIQLQSSGGCQSQSSPLPMAVAASKLSSTLSDGSAYKDRQLKVPSWIIDSDIPLHPVNFDDCAVEALDNLVLDKVMHHCNSAAHAMDLITQVLRQDIRGVHQGRGKVMFDSSPGQLTANTSSDIATTDIQHELKLVMYECRLDCMLLKFITSLSEIRVTSIELYKAPIVAIVESEE